MQCTSCVHRAPPSPPAALLSLSRAVRLDSCAVLAVGFMFDRADGVRSCAQPACQCLSLVAQACLPRRPSTTPSPHHCLVGSDRTVPRRPGTTSASDRQAIVNPVSLWASGSLVRRRRCQPTAAQGASARRHGVPGSLRATACHRVTRICARLQEPG